jgi:hypothetical protein
VESTDANRRIANTQRQIISLVKYSILLCAFIKPSINNLKIIESMAVDPWDVHPLTLVIENYFG